MSRGAGSGPTNYAFCAGDGSNGGDATNANGTFILGAAQSVIYFSEGPGRLIFEDGTPNLDWSPTEATT